ncbi:hypothetical protein [Polaromonas sp.]|uniref:hypothetical protein n=1 Tax=Polaromonas sp. TaxID=1869339 RepID=UPI0024889DD8|nr:hypothetical protein [Polaromonas sp.]MDI1338144.1 hypothetical protein [Polaromonas sp.]
MRACPSRRAMALAALLAALAPAVQALDISNADFYRCVQGDCRDGQGTVHDMYQNQMLEGVWQGSKTIPGQRYLVSHPLTKGKKYEQFYGADGLMDRGSQIRGFGAMNIVPVFTGTFGRMDHAFMRARLAVPYEGVYAMGNGIEYRGRFDYMPAKGMEAGRITMGHIIFYGDKVDLEDNSKETGLFVSNSAVVGGGVVMFMPARPDYMALLQQQYHRDLQLAVSDFKQQESEKAWRTAFAILGQVALTMAGSSGGGGGSSGNRFAMDLVSGLMKSATAPEGSASASANTDPSTRLIQLVTGAALGKVTGDSGLSTSLAKAVATGIEKSNAAGK